LENDQPAQAANLREVVGEGGDRPALGRDPRARLQRAGRDPAARLRSSRTPAAKARREEALWETTADEDAVGGALGHHKSPRQPGRCRMVKAGLLQAIYLRAGRWAADGKPWLAKTYRTSRSTRANSVPQMVCRRINPNALAAR